MLHQRDSIPFVRPVILLLFGLLLAGDAASQTNVLFVGDTHFGENYQENRSENILETQGYPYMIENFTGFLQSADLVVANLETPITDLEESPFVNKSYLHWADPVLTPYHLLENNISVVSLANNHTLDYAVPGYDQTVAVLQSEGFEWFGAGSDDEAAAEPYVREFQVGGNSFTLGVIGAFEYSSTYDEDYDFYADATTPGTNLLSASAIEAQVAALRAEYPGIFIVAFPHWGRNYRFKTDDQTEMGHDLILAGVDMVIGHGAHMIQEVELYHDRWIVYSLGNMVFGSSGRYASNDAPPYGFLLELILEDGGAAIDRQFRLYPIFTNNLLTGFQSRFVTLSEFDEVETLLLDLGGAGSWDALHSLGQDGDGNRYLEFPFVAPSIKTEFMYDDFEPGTLGNYTLGSTADGELKTGNSYCRYESCIRLQDDNGIESAFYTTNPFDASGQDRIEVEYWTRSRNGEDGDSYFVKYFDGSTYQTVATFVHGTDFTHNDEQNRIVVIDSSSYTMSSEARIMFEASGTDNSDDFYFDQIRVTGFTAVPEPGFTMLLILGVGFLGTVEGWRRH